MSQIVITEDLNIISIIDAYVVKPCMSAVHGNSLDMPAPTPVLLSMCFTAADPQLYQGKTLKDRRTAG